MKWLKRVGLIGLIFVVLVGACLWLTAYLVTARYQSDDTPQGVAYNYHLALIRGDYGRAYGYLSSTLPEYPASVNEFRANLQHSPGGDTRERRCIYIETVQSTGLRASVTLFEQGYPSWWCVSTQPPTPENLSFNLLEVALQREGEAWKIINSSGHFAKCWATVEEDCP